MSRLTNEAPLTVDRPDLVHRVREVLDLVGFDEKHIYERFGVGEQGQLTLGPLDRPRLCWRTRDNDHFRPLFACSWSRFPSSWGISGGPSRPWIRPTGPTWD